jgi:hypothetical protein
MKTPYLNKKIKLLEETLNNGLIHQGSRVLYANELHEYKAIKQLIENTPIVSTPDNPVWVVDDWGNKRILLADFGEKCELRYALIDVDFADDFLNNGCFDITLYDKIKPYTDIIPYTQKVNIEVTEEEAVKVEEFLKGLRDGN